MSLPWQWAVCINDSKLVMSAKALTDIVVKLLINLLDDNYVTFSRPPAVNQSINQYSINLLSSSPEYIFASRSNSLQ